MESNNTGLKGCTKGIRKTAKDSAGVVFKSFRCGEIGHKADECRGTTESKSSIPNLLQHLMLHKSKQATYTLIPNFMLFISFTKINRKQKSQCIFIPPPPPPLTSSAHPNLTCRLHLQFNYNNCQISTDIHSTTTTSILLQLQLLKPSCLSFPNNCFGCLLYFMKFGYQTYLGWGLFQLPLGKQFVNLDIRNTLGWGFFSCNRWVTITIF